MNHSSTIPLFTFNMYTLFHLIIYQHAISSQLKPWYQLQKKHQNLPQNPPHLTTINFPTVNPTLPKKKKTKFHNSHNTNSSNELGFSESMIVLNNHTKHKYPLRNSWTTQGRANTTSSDPYNAQYYLLAYLLKQTTTCNKLSKCKK